jgi:hypothetical protein
MNFQSPRIDEGNIQNWWSSTLDPLSFRKQRSLPVTSGMSRIVGYFSTSPSLMSMPANQQQTITIKVT